jgi:hypothetical protein
MRRFTIPLVKLTVGVANLFLFNMPLVVLEIVVQVKQWAPFHHYACAAMVHPHWVEAATTLIYLLAYQRVLNDVIMGFAADRQVGGGGVSHGWWVISRVQVRNCLNLPCS